MKFDLKFEISDGKNLVKFGGEDFSTRQESTGNFGENFGANFGPNFGEKFGNFVSNFGTFCGNFVQQRGGANTHMLVQYEVERDWAFFHVSLRCYSICLALLIQGQPTIVRSWM